MSEGPINPGSEGPDDLVAAFGFESDTWLDLMRDAAAPEALGTVGGYRIVAEVSRGAQGAVFRAEHVRTGREVALKRPTAGVLAGAEERERFRREVEAGAILHHPNIVGFEGIEVVDGQPLLVMEWIEGLAADKWAIDSAGELREPRVVLGTFAKICDAVSYAHQRGVIHRDLKPSNILIDGAGEPHVLDFGLARLAPGVGPEISRLTRTDGFVGTPVYAPPEQLEPGAHGADVRGDVYALGVVLYEMLAGRRPFGDESDWERLLLAIRRQDPAPPSRHRPGLGEELDAIVLRAIAKEPERRYQSVHALGADVRHYLAGEPVDARRDSAWYVLRKTLRRRRGVVAVGTAFVLLLMTATVVATVLWRRAEQQRDTAQRHQEEAETLAELLTDMLGSALPCEGGASYTVRQMLDQFAATFMDGVEGQPEIEATVHATLGMAYRELGEYDSAEPHLAAALEIRRGLFGPEHLLVAKSLLEWARFVQVRGDYAAAAAMCREVLATRRKLLGDMHPDVAESLAALALNLRNIGELDEAELLAQESLEVSRAVHGDHDYQVATALGQLADIARERGELTRAEDLWRESVELLRELLPPTHPRLAEGLNNLAVVVWRLGRPAEAEGLFREALEINKQLYQGDHPSSATMLFNIAAQLADQDKPDEALSYYQQATDMRRRIFGEGHPAVAASLNNPGKLLQRMGDLEGAERMLREGVDIEHRLPTPDKKVLSGLLSSLGSVLVEQGRPQEAESVLRECLALYEKDLSPDAPQYWRVPNARSLLGEAIVAQATWEFNLDPSAAPGRLREAESLLVESAQWLTTNAEHITVPNVGERYVREAGERVVRLYELWDAAEPGKGYDTKAAEWRARLESALAAGQMNQPGPSP